MVNWTDGTNKQLLLILLDVSGVKLTSAQFQEAATRMGPGFSASGVAQQYQKKLRKELGATPTATGSVDEATTKPKASKSASTKGGKGKERKRKQPEDYEEADGEDVGEAKESGGVSKKLKVKQETDEEE